MRRNKENLGFWLEPKQAVRSGIRNRLSRIIALPQIALSINNLPLHQSSRIVSLDESLKIAATLREGITRQVGRQISFDNSAGLIPRVVSLELPGAAVVRTVEMPGRQQAIVRQASLLNRPNVRMFPTKISKPAVGGLYRIQESAVEVKDGGKFILPVPGIRTMTERIFELSHRLESVDIETISLSERRGFLREAAALKYVPESRAELLAVFRHLPIEMISSLRFVAHEKAILYKIDGNTKRTRTRLHDMAAIRDVQSGEIHLVPHRTQFTSLLFGEKQGGTGEKQ